MWLWFEGVRYHKGYNGDVLAELTSKAPLLVWDVILVISPAGVDGAHLSAGAGDGNSDHCQVGRCSDGLHR